MSPLENAHNLKGREYWRSLDQVADTPEFREFLHREFPQGASELGDSITRRNFLTLMGASLALAGLAGCRKPVEKIVPYVVPPEELVPGIPQHYATSFSLGTNVYGALVESHDGRPTKIDGNEKHPATPEGKSNSLLQAAILNMYDPDRSTNVLEDGGNRRWAEFVVWWQDQFNKFRNNGGEGLAVLSEAFASPTLSRLRQQFLTDFPNARWIAYEPVSDENRDTGLRTATGRDVRPLYHLDRAKRIVALDCDVLLTESESVAATYGYAAGRRMMSPSDDMNRLYAVEGTYSLTGTKAEHRLRVSTRHIPAFTIALARTLQERGIALPVESLPSVTQSFDAEWLDAVADDLIEHRGDSVVLAGRHQPQAVHALVYAINRALDNVGKTVELHEYVDTLTSNRSALKTLVADMQSGSIETLVMIGGNPVFNTPATLDFAKALERVRDSVHLSTHVDETSNASTWHLPRTHTLEAWGDVRATDGTRGIIQPLISPMFNGHSDVELAGILTTGRDQRGYDLVRDTWKEILPAFNFEKDWKTVLHDGVHTDSAGTPVESPDIDRAQVAGAFNGLSLNGQPSSGTPDVRFISSPAVYDGRYANNGWMQELPDSVTKIAWDNPALIAPATARELGVGNGDMVELSIGGRSLELPVWIQPGLAHNEVTVMLGYGRTSTGRVGDGVGFNTYQLQSADSPDLLRGVQIRRTGSTYTLANTQDHGSMEGRPIVREATLDEFRAHPTFAREMVEHPPLKSLWQEHSYEDGNQWGMSIDLNTCTGCNACTVACQSENNIPIVGKEQVVEGREMHWIRIDRYYSGPEDDPEVVHQPVTCQHCENAPCEQVCPVAATLHSEDGLNTMVYNRCIGTRYCSNNCPYKVRRFNFFNYTKDTPPVEQLAMNPDVTIRFRGVMEKCTYCTQRISRARITAKNEEREIR
ncbi:MAG: 4Fe-4S dicluster domain-containing protein, partial [candidate division Zixibacteria bacterium]|nr:4Fe-4S dicluster domain-containing protein [candidate division Zixibacteria bacterium]